MKAIVCGAGQVGVGIARALAREGNAVTVVDWSPRLIDSVVTELDVRGVVGHGSHPDVLQRAGAAEADLLVAVTHSDETNMVACQVAHSLFNTPMRIARVRAQNYLDPAWGDLFSTGNLPVDVVISPELEVGRAILQRVETPGAFNTAVFSGGRVQLLGLRLDENSPVAGSTTEQLMELFPDLRVAVVGVQREQTLFIPKRTDPLLAGDDVYVVTESAHVKRMLDIFGRSAEKIRRVVVIGAGNIGVYVARALERADGVKVRLVEASKEHAEFAAEKLKKTVVLHGDGLDARLMREAGVPDAELVVCVTNDDKVNLLSAVMAKREGAKRALSLVNERAFESLREALGIDVLIDPRATTVSIILQHIRRGRITGLQSLGGGLAEALEGIALSTSPLVGKSLDTLELPDGVALCAVVRGDRVILPCDEGRIRENDRVLLFCNTALIPKVEHLFRVSLEYF
ncbi:Trk system potassium transporter TrkA [uncultured Maricaulis sp.]|uniref:Trk system potassium transporter TrkA n=1 Tax=uncultured Maricaulis sp. TaxID=174710 RepID=UPI0030D83846|tara:strand:- start:123888 stop:125261 length:1374 start_codon:yes stop_codon:yes gene_type:complete